MGWTDVLAGFLTDGVPQPLPGSEGERLAMHCLLGERPATCAVRGGAVLPHKKKGRTGGGLLT
jgi:hypothetical protein